MVERRSPITESTSLYFGLAKCIASVPEEYRADLCRDFRINTKDVDKAERTLARMERSGLDIEEADTLDAAAGAEPGLSEAKRNCRHPKLNFGSGDYYIFCHDCSRWWCTIEPTTHKLAPEQANQGEGSQLSGEARVKERVTLSDSPAQKPGAIDDWQPIETAGDVATGVDDDNQIPVLLWIEDGGWKGQGCIAFGYILRRKNDELVAKPNGYSGFKVTLWRRMPAGPSSLLATDRMRP